jgi:hypothetical protein
MKVLTFLIALLVFGILPASAQDVLLTRDLTKTFKRYDLLRMDAESVQQAANSGQRVRIRAYGRDFEFDLESFDLRAPNYRAIETNSNGSYEMPREDAKTYRGKLIDDPRSEVRLTIDSKTFDGLIYTGNTKYFVTKARQFSKNARADDLVFYTEGDLSAAVDLTDDISRRVEDQSQLLFQPGTEFVTFAELRQIEVATEADFQWVSQAGSASAANTEILSVMNMVDGIYRRDLNLTVLVTYQHAWSSTDPFSKSSMSELLDSFLSYWNKNYSSTQYPRDTTHLFTGKFSSQGLAYVGVVCRSPDWAYGVTARSGGANHLIAAHEIGHNLGADHVASSGICINSMMNPFISSAVTAFCSTSISAITTYVAGSGSCLTVVGNGAPTPAPTPFPSPTPTIAPSPTPTIAPSPTPTLAPFPTPTIAPSPTPTIAPFPTPTVPPSPTPTPTPNPNVRTNFALPLNGGVASSSSGFGNAAIDGSRTWAAGGAWKDTDPFLYPDWLQLDFGGTRTIDEIDVYGVRDDFASVEPPTVSTISTLYNLVNFDVQYWNGFGWSNVPGGSVTGNSNVVRRVIFAPVTTSKVRVVVNSAADGYSRIVELEAWGGGTVSQPLPTPPTVASPTPTLAPSPTPTVAPTPAPTIAPNPTPGVRTNFALATNNARASASSELASATLAIDGLRSWAASGSWKDSTPSAYPDWMQVDFNGPKTIDEISVYGVRDDFTNTDEPDTATVSSVYGLKSFAVQYWNGSGWVNIPGGSVTGNNLVLRKFTFAPVTTSRVRVLIDSAADGFSRIVELEAWGGGSTAVPQASPTPTVAPSPTPTVAPSPTPAPTPKNRSNVALASNGASASASSALSAASLAIDGEKAWAVSGSWKDSTPFDFPDWLQVDFNGANTIDEIVLYGVRDDYTNVTEPDGTTVSTAYGLVNFNVQYWNGSSWVNVMGGNIKGNGMVRRKLSFSPVTTSKIRVSVDSAADGYSRIVELEAWSGSSGSSIPEPVPTPSARSNYAGFSKGGSATASSTLGAASSAIDGSLVWSSGGSWKDDSANVYPDWMQVDFEGAKIIDEINVYGVKDDFESSESPTTAMTATRYGLSDFEVQYWTGAEWSAVPNGRFVGNNKVVNHITFSPLSTTSIRVVVTGAQDGYSRIVELEAWGGGTASATTGTEPSTADQPRRSRRPGLRLFGSFGPLPSMLR